jgi:hypothetical protein
MKFVSKNGCGEKTLYAIHHHAKSLGDVGTALLAALGTSDLPGEYGSRRGGVNSWYVHVQGRNPVYLFGNKGFGVIEIRDRVRGPVLRTIATRAQAIRWVHRERCAVCPAASPP